MSSPGSRSTSRDRVRSRDGAIELHGDESPSRRVTAGVACWRSYGAFESHGDEVEIVDGSRGHVSEIVVAAIDVAFLGCRRSH